MERPAGFARRQTLNPDRNEGAARAEIARFIARVRARAGAMRAAAALLLLVEVALLVLIAGLPPVVLAAPWARLAYLTLGGAALVIALVVAIGRVLRGVPDVDLAAAVESAVPGQRLGDRLRSSVELASPPVEIPGATSRLLVELHHRATAAELGGIAPEAVLPGRVLKPALVRSAALVGLVAAVLVLAPGALGAWFAALVGSPMPQAVASTNEAPREPGLDPALADLALTYRYPAYTGLEPSTVKGATGEIRALRGTEVELRASVDRPVTGGRLWLEPGDPVPVEVAADGRSISALLTVRSDGIWQAELSEGGGPARRDPLRHALAVDEDTPPRPAIDEPTADLELDERAVVDVAWSASDDYGLSELTLVIEHAGRKERRALATGAAPAREARGRQKLALRPYGLGAGEELVFWLEARDNDTVSGPKSASSPQRRIRIRSATTQHDQLIAKLEALFEDLTGSLDTALTAQRAAPHNVRAVADVEDVLAQRLASHRTRLDEALRELWQDPLGSDKTYAALAGMALRLAELHDESSSLLKREAPALGRPVGDEALVRSLGALRDKGVGELETDVLALDDILHREKGAVLTELARQIAEDQKTLASLLDEHRRTGSKDTLAEAQRLLARMKARIAEFEQRSAAQASGMAEEFVNLDAIREQMQALSGGSIESIEKRLAEGDLEAAAKEAGELAARLARAAAAFQRGPSPLGALAQTRAADELGRAIERVKALRDAQGRLVESTDAVKREQDARSFGAGRDAAPLFAREARRAAEVAEAARAAARELDADPELQELAVRRRRLDELSREAAERLGRGEDPAALGDLRDELFRLRGELGAPALNERLEARERLREAARHADQAAQALSARSLDSAQDAAHAAERRLREAERRLARAEQGSASAPAGGATSEPGTDADAGAGAGSQTTSGAAAAASELARNLEAMARIGDQPAGAAPGQPGARDNARLAEMARKQRTLRGEAGEIGELVKQVAEQQPELPPDLDRNLGQAADYMDVAARGLDAREVGDGHRNASAARDRLDEALASLEKAEQACRNPGSGGGSGSGGGAGGGALAYVPSGVDGKPRFGGRGDNGQGSPGGREGVEGPSPADKVEIPQAGAEGAPESFRKDVLEGMKEPRPKGFEATLEEYYRRLTR